MLLGSLEVIEILAMDWVQNDFAIFLKSLGFWRSDGALLIPTLGSPLIAMYYIQEVLKSMTRPLTKQEIGEFKLQDATCRNAINELSNLYMRKSALTADQVTAITTGLRTPPYSLASLGATYQEHAQVLLRLFLATFNHWRFQRNKPDGVEAVFVLSVHHPEALSPEILATAYVNEQTGDVRVQHFPSTQYEAESHPHAKVVEITATYTAEGTHAVRLCWANKSLEQARRTMPAAPAPAISPLLTPLGGSTISAPPPIVTTPTTPLPSVKGNSDSNLHIVLGQPPFTACGVIISMIRFGWDFTQDNNDSTHPLDEITAGLTAANLIDYIPRDTDGSRDEYIRTQILLAREHHHLYQASSEVPFHTYEVYLAFTSLQAVGHGTDSLSHYEVAKQAPAKWERTIISFQCITQHQYGLFTPESRVLFSRSGNLGETNYDAYCMDGLKQAIMLMLPQDAGDVLILRTGLGQQHIRPSTGSIPGKRSSRGGARVQSVGGILTIFFAPHLLNTFIDAVSAAITGPKGSANQPVWTSLLQDQSRRHIITEELLRHNNPALVCHGLLRFDLYLTTELTKIPVEPLHQACNVVQGQFFSVIHLNDVPMTQVIHQFTVADASPPEWKVCIGMAQWPRPNVGDVPLYDFLPNRRGACLLIITKREARLPTIRIGDRTFSLDAYNMHPIVVRDRQTTTLGNLMFTAELPNAGHYNRLSAELCDLLRVPINNITRPIRDGNPSLLPNLRSFTQRGPSYKEAVGSISSSSSGDSNSSLTTSSSSDHLLVTLTQTMSLFQQQSEELREEVRQRSERERVRDDQQRAFNLQILAYLQQREGGPHIPPPSGGV